MAHAVSTRQPTRGQNNAHTPGIHLLHVGAAHSSPDPLLFRTLCSSLASTFHMLLGSAGTSLDVVRISLGIASSPMCPQPLPTPSHLSGLSLSLSLSFPPLHLRRGTTLRHLVFTFYTSVWATHSPNRSPPHKPSLATEHTIASIYPGGEKAELSMQANTSTCFLLLPMSLFVF